MALLRCSQPNTGPNGRRCREDEQMVNDVLSGGKRIRGYILDTRSVNIAKLATAKGFNIIFEHFVLLDVCHMYVSTIKCYVL